MRKTGGKFLGQGAAACVVSPPIKCINGSTQYEGVGKLFHDENSAFPEIDEAEKVKLMDTDSDYTNPILKHCVFLRKDIPENDRAKCTVLLPDLEGMQWAPDSELGHLRHYQIIYTHEGVDFEKYLETKQYNIEEVLGHLLQFAKGIAFFNSKHKYSHMDIKAPNLLITKEGKALLIDFGLSKSTNEIYKTDFLLQNPYPYYPPEFRIFIHHQDILNDYDSDNVDVMKGKVIGIYKKLPNIGNEFYKRMETKYEATVSQINNKFAKITDVKNLRNEYCKAFSNKVDVFSFGIVILHTLHMLKTKFENNEKFTDILQKCQIIGEAASDIDPFTRMNIDNVVKELEKIIDPNITLGGKSSLKDLKQYLKGPTFTRIKLCNLVDKYKMQPKFKKLNKELLSNAIAEHMILHKKNVPKTPVKTAPKTQRLYKNT
jgi:serine/threonine protein kinase